jgi:hypothetical protein
MSDKRTIFVLVVRVGRRIEQDDIGCRQSGERVPYML